MKKTKIKIVKLGYQKNNIVFDKLKKYKSKIFEVEIFEQDLPKCDFEWGYSFDTLRDILTTNFDEKYFNICIGYLDATIENNLFGKKLKDNNVTVVSFYQIEKILSDNNIDIFNFVLSMIYRHLTRYIVVGESLSHSATRSCLFDMCGNKNDVIYCSSQPIICNICESKIKKVQTPDGYLAVLKKELKRIRKHNYYVIVEAIKKHPYLSLFIGIISGIIIGLITNFIFELLMNYFMR
ncbi:MAG: hypothetical protein FWC92_05610 [Defluviitaleaceae bacterium]|nr:hypothetical protein [Defluviitaleaceae bacterium]